MTTKHTEKKKVCFDNINIFFVIVPAKIRDELSSNDTVLRERETLVLVCNVTGAPRPFVTWYKLISGKEESVYNFYSHLNRSKLQFNIFVDFLQPPSCTNSIVVNIEYVRPDWDSSL